MLYLIQMKNSKNTIIHILCLLIILVVSNGCSSKHIKKVNQDIKTDFGITVTSPSQGIFFVENQKVAASEEEIEIHKKTADSIYNTYGPATDNRFVGRTNARELKFITAKKTYLIDITMLNKRTAMVLFDGKNKPVLKYNPKKYKSIVEKHFIANSN